MQWKTHMQPFLTPNHHRLSCWSSGPHVHPPGSLFPQSLQQPCSYRWNTDIWKTTYFALPENEGAILHFRGWMKWKLPCRNWYLPQVPVSRRYPKSHVSLPLEKGLLCCQLESLCTQPAFPSLSTFEWVKKLGTTLCTGKVWNMWNTSRPKIHCVVENFASLSVLHKYKNCQLFSIILHRECYTCSNFLTARCIACFISSVQEEMQSISIFTLDSCFSIGSAWITMEGPQGHTTEPGFSPLPAPTSAQISCWEEMLHINPRQQRGVHPEQKARTSPQVRFVEGAKPQQNKAAPTQHVSLWNYFSELTSQFNSVAAFCIWVWCGCLMSVLILKSRCLNKWR